MRKTLISTVAIFLAWFVLDFFIHGILLQDLYQQTAHLWRPMEEIQGNWWMHLLNLVMAGIFATLYCCYTGTHKSLKRGLCFGSKIGLMFGISMGFGMYSVMPIPLSLGVAWFLCGIVSYTVAGGIAGALIKECQCPKFCSWDK